MKDSIYKSIFFIVSSLAAIGIALLSFYLMHSDQGSLNNQIVRIDNLNVVKKYIKSYIGWNGNEGIWDSSGHGQMYFDLRGFCDGVVAVKTSLQRFNADLNSPGAFSRYSAHLSGNNATSFYKIKDEIQLDLGLIDSYVMPWIGSVRNSASGGDVPIKYLQAISKDIYIMPISDCLNTIKQMNRDGEYWVFNPQFMDLFRYLKNYDVNSQNINVIFPVSIPQRNFEKVNPQIIEEIGSLSSVQFEEFYRKQADVFRQVVLELAGERSNKIFDWVPPLFVTKWWILSFPWLIDIGMVICFILLLRLDEYYRHSTAPIIDKDIEYPYSLFFPPDKNGGNRIGKTIQVLFFLLPMLLFLSCIIDQIFISNSIKNLIGTHSPNMSNLFTQLSQGSSLPSLQSQQTLEAVLNDIFGNNESLNEDSLRLALCARIYPSCLEWIGLVSNAIFVYIVVKKINKRLSGISAVTAKIVTATDAAPQMPVVAQCLPSTFTTISQNDLQSKRLITCRKCGYGYLAIFSDKNGMWTDDTGKSYVHEHYIHSAKKTTTCPKCQHSQAE